MFRRTCKWHHAELSRACEEDALGELDEEEVASATGQAQSLAKEALACLHREQCHQRALQEAAREEVCQQERLKESSAEPCARSASSRFCLTSVLQTLELEAPPHCCEPLPWMRLLVGEFDSTGGKNFTKKLR